jgi:anti-sigma28 factor (negative regulator of flagellin synthesis)
VNELKKAITNGEYTIDAQKLAENINNLEVSLFGR